ncbi:MAG: hypothetical protein PHD19_11470 [Dechloromonas sp.]|nr:hypothetical protein [Dechloromonas sp.]
MGKKRSHRDGFAIGDLFGDAGGQGVGARQGGSGPVGGGGGYLKICGAQNFQIPDESPEDPRFLELEAIGMPGAWLRLARRVGFDAFLDVWRMISEDESTRHDGGRRMPKLREFSAYQRYQRNRYVKSLAEHGLNPDQIQRIVQRHLGERLSVCHIQGLAKGLYRRPQYDPYDRPHKPAEKP